MAAKALGRTASIRANPHAVARGAKIVAEQEDREAGVPTLSRLMKAMMARKARGNRSPVSGRLSGGMTTAFVGKVLDLQTEYSVSVSADGKLTIERTPPRGKKQGNPRRETENEALLRQARERGQQRLQDVFAAAEMLSLDEASDASGLARTTLNDKRRRGQLLAVAKPGTKRGYRYPKWQFETSLAERLPHILAALSGATDWERYFFLVTPHPALAGATPLAAIRRGEIDRTLRAAKTHANGMQGAA